MDLNDWIPPGCGCTLEQAVGINNRGQIAITTRDLATRSVRALLLTPTRLFRAEAAEASGVDRDPPARETQRRSSVQ